MDKLRQGVAEVAEEAEKAACIGRLKTEISGFNAEWEKIQELDAEIARREAEIEATKAEDAA